LPAGVLLASAGQPLLLTRETQLSTATEGFLEEHAGEGNLLNAFGGPSTLSNPLLNQAAAAFTP
jgi:hypothetical protein